MEEATNKEASKAINSVGVNKPELGLLGQVVNYWANTVAETKTEVTKYRW